MLVLSFFLAIFLDKSHSLRRQKGECPVYNTSPTDSVKGTLYKGTVTFEDKHKAKVEICCLRSVTNDTIKYFSKTSKTSCCQQLAGSPCTKGHRGCPGYSCMVRFSSGTSSIAPLSSPPGSTRCVVDRETLDRGIIFKSNITQYKNPRGCKDETKKILITSVKTGKPVDAYHTCCSVDITSNFSANPETVCCGLAGSLAPNYIENGRIVFGNTPPCCRKVNGYSTCDPTPNLPQPMKFCGGLAGSEDTPNLNERLPALAPLHYTYTDKSLVTSNQVYSCNKEGTKFFFALQNGFGSLPMNLNLCCSKNIFYSNAQKIIDDCCISYTNNEYSVSPSAPSFFKCSVKDQKKKGFIENGIFVYKPCNPSACSATNSNSGQLDRSKPLDVFLGSNEKVAPIYGVYKYYLNKHLTNE